LTERKNLNLPRIERLLPLSHRTGGVFGKFVALEDGSSLIEFALLLPMMAAILVCLTDYALLIQNSIQFQSAADAAAAYGTIPGNASNTAAMTQIANYMVTGSFSGLPSVTVASNLVYTCSPGGAQVTSSTLCSGLAPLQYVQVSVKSTVSPLMKYPGVPSSLALSGWASYRVQGTP
jgi:Flp pilus assembly protein TadG